MKDVKCHKKGFHRYRSSKRKTREIRSFMMSGTGAQVRESEEKVGVLNAFFASVFTCKIASRNTCWEPGGRSGVGKVYP